MASKGFLLWALLGGIAIYALSRNSNQGSPNVTSTGDYTQPIDQGTMTPAGNVITQAIKSPAEGTNYINTHILGSGGTYTNPMGKSYILPVGQVIAPDNNSILTPRTGGGYAITGATNITLKDTKTSSVPAASVSVPKANPANKGFSYNSYAGGKKR